MRKFPLAHLQVFAKTLLALENKAIACRETGLCKRPIPLELSLLSVLQVEWCVLTHSPGRVQEREADACRESTESAEVSPPVASVILWRLLPRSQA